MVQGLEQLAVPQACCLRLSWLLRALDEPVGDVSEAGDRERLPHVIGAERYRCHAVAVPPDKARGGVIGHARRGQQQPDATLPQQQRPAARRAGMARAARLAGRGAGLRACPEAEGLAQRRR
jgi:hypothetical protein